MRDSAADRFLRIAPRGGFWSLRIVRERREEIRVRKGVLEPVAIAEEAGAMITLREGRGLGYAATCDLSEAGLRRARDSAARFAAQSAACGLVDFSCIAFPAPRGEYESPSRIPWEEVSLPDKVGALQELNGLLRAARRAVDWSASFSCTEQEVLYLTSEGGRARQRFRYVVPDMGVAVNEGAETQRRTFGREACCRQGGWEAADLEAMREAAPRLAEEAEQLLDAPDCPEERTDLLLAPDQMFLQIHESIGHPLELDRILGDERNYAGTSFVALEMFGGYRYGSELLNVTFDPGLEGEFASYAFDDEGAPARRAHIIREGVLLRGLGGLTSQARSGAPGVACARAAGWRRPPIDRMANLNVEPGRGTLEEMIGAVERGVFMRTNCSWSIDDSRLKFQFGCEWARLIEEGRLTRVVKNPNYRGVTPDFWRSLKGVGGPETFEVLGTPYCGKGEPNQAIRVGHASPACLFSGVEVFGGA